MGLFFQQQTARAPLSKMFETALKTDPNSVKDIQTEAIQLASEAKTSTFEVNRLIFACVLLALLLIGYLLTLKDENLAELATILLGSFSSVLSILIGILIGEAAQS
jgi:MFS-type transporter involved in bile tolerance (Atg22 family)